MADQTLHCSDCQSEFVYTEGEQKFFSDRKLSPPKRCKACRDVRRASRGPVAPHKAPAAQEQKPDLSDELENF